MQFKKEYIYLIILFLLIFYKFNNFSSKEFIINLVKKNTNINFIRKNDINMNNNNNNKTVIIINNDKMFDKIILKGELGLAESYIDKDWDTDNLEEVIIELSSKEDQILKELKSKSIRLVFMQLSNFFRNKFSNNTLYTSSKNISHHYDIGNDLFKKMLGQYMQYTCGYFYKEGMSLDEAQYSKMELIAKKLDLKPNMKVLDIGCGFGSMAYHLASRYNVNVIGVTLSINQKKYSDNNYSHPKVKIYMKDYRNIKGKFDRVYSVGMFEHVGRKNYEEYYNKCYDLLKPNGIMLLHTIGTYMKGSGQSDFSNKYIFPEGQLPNLESLHSNNINFKWKLEDFQNFGKSYAKTLRFWHKNLGNWDGLDNYNLEFRRMWNFYLLSFISNFKLGKLGLWQLVYTKNFNNRKDDLHHIRN